MSLPWCTWEKGYHPEIGLWVLVVSFIHLFTFAYFFLFVLVYIFLTGKDTETAFWSSSMCSWSIFGQWKPC